MSYFQPVYVVAVSTSVGLFDIAFSESHLFFENAFPTLQKLTKQEQVSFKSLLNPHSFFSGNNFQRLHGKISTCPQLLLDNKILWKYKHKVRFFNVIMFYESNLFRLMSSVCTCFDREMPLDFFYPGNVGNKKFFER